MRIGGGFGREVFDCRVFEKDAFDDIVSGPIARLGMCLFAWLSGQMEGYLGLKGFGFGFDRLRIDSFAVDIEGHDADMERETGIGPATNSLEGCDSTIELLPLLVENPVFSQHSIGV